MELLIKDIYTSLKEKNNCDIWIDAFNRLLLFPTVSTPKRKELPYVVLPVQEASHLARGLRGPLFALFAE